MEKKENTGVIIGRFQVPYLHLGHIYLISHALQNYQRVVILLGTTIGGQVDERNPYGYEHRRDIIYDVFPRDRVFLFDLFDRPGDDVGWSESVDFIIQHFKAPVLLHSRDSFKDHYLGIYPTKEIPELPGYSGTQLRQEVKDVLLQKPD